MVHYLNVDSIFPTNIYGKLFNANENNENHKTKLDDGKYWYIQYTKISTRQS